MKNNVYCIGTSPFLNICSSGILEVNSKITYLLDPNQNSKISKIEYRLIKDIAKFFNYNVVLKKISNLKIYNNDILTGNCIRHFLPYLFGQKIIIFPEGASCFDDFVKKNFYRRLKFFLSRNFKKFFYRQFYIIKKKIYTP